MFFLELMLDFPLVVFQIVPVANRCSKHLEPFWQFRRFHSNLWSKLICMIIHFKDTNDKATIHENIRKIHDFLVMIDGDVSLSKPILELHFPSFLITIAGGTYWGFSSCSNRERLSEDIRKHLWMPFTLLRVCWYETGNGCEQYISLNMYCLQHYFFPDSKNVCWAELSFLY